MKKYLLIILFLVSARVFSQSYVAFPDSNASWTVFVTGFLPPPLYESQFFISGDTLIGTTQYHKIYGCSFFNNVAGYYFGMRQDTLARQVFIKPNSLPEYLAYDFSLTVGDTFHLDTINYETFVVTIVDSILVQGQPRKRLQLTSIWPSYICEPEWIEGIGSTYGFFPVHCNKLTVSNLVCFSQNNQLVFPDTGSCPPCAVTSVGVNLIQDKLFTVSPNPFDSEIAIKFPTQISGYVKITIRDIFGKAVYDKSESNFSAISDKKIDLNFLVDGIYILDVVFDNKRVINKIIKK